MRTDHPAGPSMLRGRNNAETITNSPDCAICADRDDNRLSAKPGYRGGAELIGAVLGRADRRPRRDREYICEKEL